MSNLCEYYGSCGGCSFQHLSLEEYKKIKEDSVYHVVEQLKVNSSVVSDIILVGERSRRRVELKVAVNKKAVSLGFYTKKTHDVVNIADCPVTQTQITNIITPLRVVLESLKKPSLIQSISIAVINDGLDFIFTTKSALVKADLQKIIDFCDSHQVP